MTIESPYPMLSVAEALATVLSQTEALPAQLVELSAALGLVLAFRLSHMSISVLHPGGL